MNVVKNIIKAIGLMIARIVQLLVIAIISTSIVFGFAAVIIFLLPESASTIVSIALIVAGFIGAFMNAYEDVTNRH